MNQPDLFGTPPSQPYFNTTHLPAPQLREAQRVAVDQEHRVLAVLILLGDQPATPSQVHACGLKHGDKWLLTSVRRAMSVLTVAGRLKKLDRLAPGPNGRPEHLWRRA